MLYCAPLFVGDWCLENSFDKGITGLIATDNPGPKGLQAMQVRRTTCGGGRTPLEKERTLLSAASEIWNRATISIKPAHKLILWDHSILKVRRVFSEKLWPCRRLFQYLNTFLLQAISCQVWYRLLKLFFSHFYWCCMFSQSLAGWPGPKIAIESHFIFAMMSCWPSVYLMHIVSFKLSAEDSIESFWSWRSQLLQVSLPTFPKYLCLFQCQYALAGH